MHCENTTFAYNNDFNDYMKVDGVELEDIFDYLFDVGAGKFLSEEGQKYLLELLEEYDLEYFNQISQVRPIWKRDNRRNEKYPWKIFQG